MRRRRANAGESIAETLVAVLLMTLVFLMLTGAVVTAAHINEAIKNEQSAFSVGETPGELNVTLTIDGWGESDPIPVNAYQSEGYTYYEAIKTGA